MEYKLINDENGKLRAINKFDGDLTTTIPVNEANTDYQEYLKWLAKGNQPLPADE